MPAGKIHVNLCNPRIKGHVFRPQIIQIYTDYCIDIAYRNVFLQPELASRRDHDIVGRGLKVLDGTGYAGRSCRPTFVLHSVLPEASGFGLYSRLRPTKPTDEVVQNCSRLFT